MTPTAHFESFRRGRAPDGWNVSLANPARTLVARRLDEVVPLLREAESAVEAGSWVALAVSYEAAPAFDSALEVHDADDFPLAWCAVFDGSSAHRARPAGKYVAGKANRGVQPDVDCDISALEPALSADDYLRAIESIRNYIAAGDTYQVNFTFPLHGTAGGDLLRCFRTVAAAQGAGYSAYLDMGSHRILSFSPELFFRRDGDRLTTRPMKGTAPRGRWLGEDDGNASALRESLKDRAENVMIVDLLRNDLGRVAQVGTVDVPELFAVERFNRVLQMTSTVTAVAKPGTSLADIFAALFPCGSVTGAPKVRSTEIIRELEQSPRGIYTGAIGVIAPNGDAVFNVAIRTLVVNAATGAATLGVGGGITWGSTVEGEYDESLLKASFLTDRWPRFDLLETLALRDGEFDLLERHLDRARDSAEYFLFDWHESQVRGALDTARSSHPAGSWRVRLLVDRTGVARIEAEPLAELKNLPLRVRLAKSAIDDTDPLLFHKISERSRYESALAECQPCDDVIFWNASEEVTESTIANIVVEIDGLKWTPPRESGLLAGTFRDELIARGEVRERVISCDELRRAKAGSFFLVNSVRGWMPAKLVER